VRFYWGDLHRFEWWLLGATILAALLWPRRWRVALPPAPRACWKGVLLVTLVALALRLALAPFLPPPEPSVGDEFSYLLQADTFASGRATNPTHPLWPHFESYHIFHQPTYQSMYPPVQGLLLALGQRLGHPWIGVWLSGGLACGAICWMLYGWFPARWALLGGWLAVLKLAAASYWTTTYWGGAHAAAAGALVLGALPRLRRAPAASTATLLALGLAILANSRPYEGLLLAVVAGAYLWRPLRSPRVLLPVAAALALTAAAMGWYFWRVTGDPLRMPYQVNRATYGWPATLPWMDMPVLEYRHATLRAYAGWERDFHNQYDSWSGFALWIPVKTEMLWSFFLGPSLTLPFLLGLRGPRLGPLAWTTVVVLAGVGLGQTAAPHYAAPAAGSIVALTVEGLRVLRTWRVRGRRTGRLWAAAAPAILLLALALRIAPSLHLPVYGSAFSWCCAPPGNLARAALRDHLQRQPGKLLVIVRYAAHHNFHQEWVYNRADIDGAKVVWAREMSAEENRRLLEYFRDRRALLVEPDERPPRLSDYRLAPGGPPQHPDTRYQPPP
jgi:hypothetical protein